MSTKEVDKPFLYIVISLVVLGLFIFSSAALGLVARDGYSFGYVFLRQVVLGVILGSLVAYITSRIPYKVWARNSLYLFIASLLLTLAVWIPGLGFEHGGAKRWLSFGLFSFQPAEFLKFAFIVYASSWVASVKDKIRTWRYGFFPFMIMLAVASIVLLIQPDTDTLVVIAAAGLGIFLAGGLPWKQFIAIILIGVFGLSAVIFTRPYLMQRVETFLNPASDPLGSGYQIQQSLLAVGSGRIFGRGLGQSVQKFSYLPEPMGDSIFAVYAEEWGLLGSLVLLGLFTGLALRGLRIAARAPSVFSGLLVTGIVIVIVFQSLLNIAAMLGVIPLSGMPLLFVSQGGSAMLFALAMVGVVLQVSRYQRSG